MKNRPISGEIIVRLDSVWRYGSAGASPSLSSVSALRKGGRGSRRAALFIGLLSAVLCAHTAFAGPLYRPSQEQRTVTASSYKMSVQKNGRIDVSLLSGEAVFLNAYPAILFEGESEWTELDIASRYTFRERVNDALGQGQALIMAKGNCEWAIRTYSTQPFFTVQAVFINTTKKPVRVLAASPWSMGNTRKPGGLWLGKHTPNSRALVLEELPQDFVGTRMVRGVPLESQWQTGLYNAETGRSLIAGFLELSADESSFTLDRLEGGGENSPIELFQAITTFKDPVDVAPGERLEMPMVYFAVSESDPLVGLRRFGQALGRFSGVRVERPAELFIDGGVPSTVLQLRELGWLAPSESNRGVGSAESFRNARGDIAQLNPNAPSSWDDVVNALTQSARLFHLNSYFWRADAGHVRLDLDTLTDSQRLAWITGAAFTGGTMHVELGRNTDFADTLRRFTPAINRSAFPVDLFRNERPQIWSLPMDGDGEHVVAGLFNWGSEEPVTIDLRFAELGLARKTYYTVYEPLPRQYMGTASEQLRVEVPPGSVRIVSLRRHEEKPVVLAYGDHVTTARPDDASKWDAATNTLSGTVRSIGIEPVRVDVLVPERFGTTTSSSKNVRVEWQDNERVLMLYVSGRKGALVEWRVEFR